MLEEIETAKMSTRGQIIIPKDIREFIHAKKETIFTVAPLDEETIIMKKMDKKKLLEEFRSIRKHVKKKLSEGEIEHEIKAARKRS